MAYYKVCPKCGGCLDPGERCDCEDEGRRGSRRRMEYRAADQIELDPETGQYKFKLRMVG